MKKKDKVFKDGRIRLANKSELRRQRFELDGYLCQPCKRKGKYTRVTWETGHLSHLAHGSARRDDTLNGTETSCAQCHSVDTHNPKPCPPKPKIENLS